MSKHISIISELSHLCNSHGLFRQIFPVSYDVRHAILSNGNFAAINPLPQDVSSPFILAGLLAQGVQLLLKVLYALALLFDLAVVLVVDGVHDLLHLELVTHHRLSSPPLATCLEDVYTSSLGCYQ